MIEIDAQPTMNPLDVPTPRASEIVRNWPDAMWGEGTSKIRRVTGEVRFCAIGILAETGGHDWGMPWSASFGIDRWEGHCGSAAGRFVGNKYGLNTEQLNMLIGVNDGHGKEAAADLLASWGM